MNAVNFTSVTCRLPKLGQFQNKSMFPSKTVFSIIQARNFILKNTTTIKSINQRKSDHLTHFELFRGLITKKSSNLHIL